MALPPKQIPERIVVHSRDVQNITGVSERTARRLLNRIKIFFDKTPHQYVTVDEFCAFTGIDEDLVKDFMKI